MIKTKDELRMYLDADKKALSINHKRPRPFKDRIWKYQILYRKVEYYINNSDKNFLTKIRAKIMHCYWKYVCEKWGNELPINCFEEGLHIWHGQNIIVNPNVKIGKNCQISTGVIIGQAHGQYPIIGDNINFSVDCKVLGGITVTHNVVIGAGAVVVKDITIPYSTWGGVPAKMLSIYNPETNEKISGEINE